MRLDSRRRSRAMGCTTTRTEEEVSSLLQNASLRGILAPALLSRDKRYDMRMVSTLFLTPDGSWLDEEASYTISGSIVRLLALKES